MESKTPKSDLRVVKTRRMIRETLLELMSERELSGISISELCVKAQINRKTFYRHYREVGDVISELEDDMLAEFAEVFKSHNSSILDLGAVIRDISAAVDSNREYYLRLLKHNPDLFAKGKLKAALCRMAAVSLKSSGIAEDERVISAASEFAVSGVLALYSSWFDGGCKDDLRLRTEVAVKIITQGILTIDS